MLQLYNSPLAFLGSRDDLPVTLMLSHFFFTFCLVTAQLAQTKTTLSSFFNMTSKAINLVIFALLVVSSTRAAVLIESGSLNGTEIESAQVYRKGTILI
jgi:hypothetical protein